MQKVMLMKYLNRIQDDAENAVNTEKNRIHWRKATSDDYFNIALAYARLELTRSISSDIYKILSLYP